ncbi:hypothetical protein WR25_17073 isoform A [Diploscapter pachys]|uniref:Potassium channel domain-containing protein n=1 Tax=Diploscapter pachys TaxID=2018661 RepID=A0A2A2L3S2_9BILA|nr:hypothetical protein WR25_17073 isoform A [Diploscapter pachys]
MLLSSSFRERLEKGPYTTTRARVREREGSRRGSRPGDTKKSLSTLAQLMYPALIEEGGNKNEGEGKALERRASRRNLLRRAHTQIRRGAMEVKDIAERAHHAGRRQVEKLQEKPPLWMSILYKSYHKYGGKHLVLVLIFLLYTTIGAVIFLHIEEDAQEELEKKWKKLLDQNRTRQVSTLMGKMFNNSVYLVYIKGNTTAQLKQLIDLQLREYEQELGIRWSQQKAEWNFANALLYAGSICTTIGWGNIFPVTNAGRILTMIYSLLGIPLVLVLLQDLGKLLTVALKYPWFQTKRAVRRILRCCTKQSLLEMRVIEDKERMELEIFDLPIVVGLCLIFAWVFIGSFVMSAWDESWTEFESFYFIFTSLSTIGLGDLVPSSPYLIITMFFFILIGLSLVSMVINLIQLKMKKTYEAGKIVANFEKSTEMQTSLGIMQTSSEPERPVVKMDLMTRSTQTSLSLPAIKQVVLRSDGVHWIGENDEHKSPDEVTNLLEFESSSLNVCEQLGDTNEDNSESDQMASLPTDALLEKMELTDEEEGENGDEEAGSSIPYE